MGTNGIDQQVGRGEARSLTVIDSGTIITPQVGSFLSDPRLGMVQERCIQRRADNHGRAPPDRLSDHG